MRLPSHPAGQAERKTKPLYDEMRKGIASNFDAFKVEREDGALTANASLPDNVRQVVIVPETVGDQTTF